MFLVRFDDSLQKGLILPVSLVHVGVVEEVAKEDSPLPNQQFGNFLDDTVDKWQPIGALVRLLQLQKGCAPPNNWLQERIVSILGGYP